MLRFFLLLSQIIFLVYSCPDGWHSSSIIDGKCYLLVTQRKMWFDAENYCQKAVTGGHLASISGAFENANIYAIADHQCDHLWIGLDDIDQNEIFAWLGGSQSQYTNWDAGQPATNDGQQCAAINDQKSGKWTNLFCGLANCFVCESWASSATTTVPAETTTSAVQTTTVSSSTVAPRNMTDCYDWRTIGGATTDGIYTISPPGMSSFQVWCDMTTNGGGWTVFQQRVDGTVAFENKTWNEYKNGFDNGLNNNMWLGNDRIHALSTKDRNVTLHIDLWGDQQRGTAYQNAYWYGEYSSFYIDNEANQYMFHVSCVLNGNASRIECAKPFNQNDDTILYNNMMNFSTIDVDNDKLCNSKGACTQPPKSLGGWWLCSCTYVSLNGKYIPAESHYQYGIEWETGDYYINPARSRMMLRKVS